MSVVINIEDFSINGKSSEYSNMYSLFPNLGAVPTLKVLKSESDIEFLRVAAYFTTTFGFNVSYSLGTALIVRSKSLVYYGENASSANELITREAVKSDGNYYGYIVNNSYGQPTTSSQEIELTNIAADYYFTLAQSNNVKGSMSWTDYYSSSYLYKYAANSWFNGTIDNDENITPLGNKMSSYEGINPTGETETMCEISVKKVPCILKLTDCIPNAGTYTLQFWIKSDNFHFIDVFNTDRSFLNTISTSNRWNKYVLTFTVNSADSLYIRFNEVADYYLYHVKLEVGETATPWTAYGSNGYVVEPLVFGTINVGMSAFINNMSDDDTGFVYTIHCKGEVENIIIYNEEANESMKINGTFKLNDIITIDTRRGKKSITKNYRGTVTNIINSLDNTSKWLQLRSGYNHIIQSADSGAEFMQSSIVYTNEYEGV